MAISMYLRSRLQIIYEAEDLLRPIPAEEWGTHDFCDQETRKLNMFGLYVREKLPDVDVTRFTASRFVAIASCLIASINEFLEYVAGDGHKIWGAEAIASGQHTGYPQPDPKARAMAFFEAVEAKFPRATYKEQPKPRITHAQNITT